MAIGLVLIYAVLSLVTSALVELVVQWLGIRGKNLSYAIQRMLDGEGDAGQSQLSTLLYQHPLITALYKKGRLPSYIPSKQFARVVPQLFRRSKEEDSPTSVDALKEALKEAPNQ